MNFDQHERVFESLSIPGNILEGFLRSNDGVPPSGDRE